MTMDNLAERFVELLPRYGDDRRSLSAASDEALYAQLALLSVRVLERAVDGTLVDVSGTPGEQVGLLPGIWISGVPVRQGGEEIEHLLRQISALLAPHGVLALGTDGTSPVGPLFDHAGFDVVDRFPGAAAGEHLLGVKRAQCCSGGRRNLYDRHALFD
jgi:hypothetical protein